jgi:hypothetical protein
MSTTLVTFLILALIFALIFKSKIAPRNNTKTFSDRDMKQIADMAQRIGDVINESMQIASKSLNQDTQVSRIQVAKDKFHQLEQLMEEYPFLKVDQLEGVKRDIAKLEESILSGEQASYPTDKVDEVKELKRAGKSSEAIALLQECIDSMEKNAENLGGVAPWYYEQLAILFRKEKRLADEIEVLERYSGQLKGPGVGPEKLAERLRKARERYNKAT